MQVAVNMQEVNSTSVKSVGYDGVNLYVSYHPDGKTFCYHNVPFEVAEQVHAAPSVGKFIAEHVKAKGYTFNEVRPIEAANEGIEDEPLRVEVELIGNLETSTEFSAGYDLKAAELVTVRAESHELVWTDVSIGMPSYLCALVLPRSGLARKHGLTVLNGPGLIDPDYPDKVGVIVHNITKQDYTILSGDKIAQLLFVPFVRPDFRQVEKLTPKESSRTGGFGSTGK